MRIFISLIQHMGDIVACEPAARLVKRLHNGASVTWVVGRQYSELVRYNPYVDSTVEVACLGEWISIKQHLTDPVYDLNVNYGVCSNCCGLRLIKTGLGSEVNCANWFDYGPLLPAFLRGAGLPPVSDAPVFWKKQAGLSVSTDLLGKPYVVIQISSNETDKNWDLLKWQQFCDWLRSLGYVVVEVGLVSSCLTSVKYFDNTNLQDIANLIDGATAFVGVDSGFAHMANALRKRSVLIFGKYRAWDHRFPYTGIFEKEACIVRSTDTPAAMVTLDAVKTGFVRLMER
jgi:ADP-heptose:LPS heptosyltransferase